MTNIPAQKSRARKAAKARRAAVHDAALSPELIQHFPASEFRGAVIGGFWPLAGEIDIRPLMRACYDAGHKLALPCTPPAGQPLTFRAWSPEDTLKIGPYNTREPFADKAEIAPTLILLPLLAFSVDGKRLGYGGGFYDRTIEGLRKRGDVFACGTAYAAQEAAEIPIDQYDQKLDGILTEQYFRKFT